MRYEIVVYDYSVEWFKDGKFHREYGPAEENCDGRKYWRIEDKAHRLDGPAWQWPSGHNRWYINNKQYTEKYFKKKIKSLKT